jgi:hypothetical protein
MIGEAVWAEYLRKIGRKPRPSLQSKTNAVEYRLRLPGAPLRRKLACRCGQEMPVPMDAG